VIDGAAHHSAGSRAFCIHHPKFSKTARAQDNRMGAGHHIDRFRSEGLKNASCRPPDFEDGWIARCAVKELFEVKGE
jgi:hypothetical protein